MKGNGIYYMALMFGTRIIDPVTTTIWSNTSSIVHMAITLENWNGSDHNYNAVVQFIVILLKKEIQFLFIRVKITAES